jgi:adenine-specific DNA-methyltransferase
MAEIQAAKGIVIETRRAANSVAETYVVTVQKRLGQYFTPTGVAETLVRWTIRRPSDRLLDPSCGDGQFIANHARAVGVEVDADNARIAQERAPGALIHCGDFFRWSAATTERFEAIAGNPPFIRYQRFSGTVRSEALAAASLMGAHFSALTSSWAPFVIVAAGLLRPGGRMAFVVPSEVGHSTYARALVPALCEQFGNVHFIAYREKLFPQLSEDCWLLYCSDYGQRSDCVHLSALERFTPTDAPPEQRRTIRISEWQAIGERLRPFLLSDDALSLYRTLSSHSAVCRLAEVATANIGYVTGANDFFHLRPSDAKRLRLPDELLRVAIRKSEQLPNTAVDRPIVDDWLKTDRPVLLLDLRLAKELPDSVQHYLNCEGVVARESYKCRNRKPWYVVPDVKVPHAFLPVMSGGSPRLVRNDAGCVCSNSLLAVNLKNGLDLRDIQVAWNSPLAQLGTEIEGHPLGGGLLKLEPREACRVPIALTDLHLAKADEAELAMGLRVMRQWRHHAETLAA